MDFENQYLSYEEYQRFGGEIQGAPFDLLEYRAEKEIDKATFNRFRNLNSEKYPMELKICVYELMETLTKYDNLDTDISSEKVGDYSITRDSKEQREKNKAKDIEVTIDRNLSQIEVNGILALYRGADC